MEEAALGWGVEELGMDWREDALVCVELAVMELYGELEGGRVVADGLYVVGLDWAAGNGGGFHHEILVRR